jgi:outer membrane protein assembly factor BamB
VRSSLTLVAGVVLAVLSPTAIRDSVAQAPAGSSAMDASQNGSAFVPPVRSVVLLLDRTRQLLRESRYAEAVQCLDRILSANEDFFFKSEANASVHHSIKSEARRLLGSLPTSGRQSYELQFGSIARSKLDEAVETGDIPSVAEVARRFFHTEAGYEATFLLGLHHMDHGRPLVAALTLRRLRDESPTSERFEPSLSLAMARNWLGAGMPDQARQALDALRDDYRDRIVTIEGRDVPLFETADDSVEWLLASLGPENAGASPEPVDWTIHGGSPERNAVSQASRPLLSPDWFVPTTDNPAVEDIIDRLRRQQEEREKALLPGLHPLVVNDVVLMRTATNLLAVDFQTGKRLWEVAADDPFEAALNPPPGGYINYQPNIETGLRLRLWGDGVFGTLASDGKLVFAVEDLQLPLPAIHSRGIFMPGNVRSSSTSLMTSNRLAAFDILSEGKLRWEVGASHAEKLPLAGAFFLGPPLPLLGNLYVLAEIDGEVRLLALKADNGELLWQQQLAVVDQSVFQNRLRRVSGVSPSYADGVLVCPTSHHSIVALDLTTRSLLWGYSYADLERRDQRVPNRLTTLRDRTADPEDRWTDSSLVVADGHILATPTDSDQLHCLSLRDGKLLWHAPREDKRFVATVGDDRVVLATRKGLTALNLENGKTAWQTPLAACPANSEPSGRGFSDGELYYLPLTGSKLMTVQLATGRVEQVLQSRRGRTLGNLVCHNGRIISQRADGIESYHQIEALRQDVNERLAAQPDDARALALRGEILWDDGELDAAVECLRESLQLNDSLRTRTLFRDAMLDGLEKDFVRYHGFRDEIEPLLQTPDDWSTFHRLVATGWEEAGEYDGALAELRLLVELDLQRRTEEDDVLDVQVGEDYSLRQHRWIRTRLHDLAEAAPTGVQAELLGWVDETLQNGQDTEGPNAIGNALQYFHGLPGTRKFRDDWIDRLVKAGRLAEAELALMRDIRASEAPLQSRPLERWADLLLVAHRPADASSLLTAIETRWADIPFPDGQNGHQWALEFTDRHDAIRQSRQPTIWPRGLVKTSVAESEQGSVVLSHSRGFIPFQNSKGLFCRGLVIEHHRHQQQLIVAKNRFGRIEWQFPLNSITEQEQLPSNQVLTRVDACGHLLILSMGNQTVALDTLVTKDDGTPTIAWREPIDRAGLSPLQRHAFPAQIRNAPGWFGGSSLMNPAGYSLGATCMLGDSLVCIKRARTCVALDLATGKTLWERKRISAQSAVFGDDRYVLIAPPQATEARVLRAHDGAELEPCAIPPNQQRLMTIGREILCWEPLEEGDHLKLIDPLESGEKRIVWGPHQFSDDSRHQMVDREVIAVFTPSGKFQLVRLADGEMLVDTQLETEKTVTDVVVLRHDDHFFVVANNRDGQRASNRHVSPVTGLQSWTIGIATIYCFDSHGNSLWDKPAVVENHSLPLIQPRGAPCLTFACMVRETTPGQPRQARFEILCLDTRSGAIIAQEQFAHASHRLEIAAVPDEARVEIRMQQETLSLQFTDEPIPERDNSKGEAVRVPGNSLKAIWHAILDGTAATEEKSPTRNAPRQATVKEVDEAAAKEAGGQAVPAAKDKAATANDAVPQPQRAALPPPLEPAIRNEIVPK